MATYRFDYPVEFTTIPELSARRGALCTAVRALRRDEFDFQGEAMFLIRFDALCKKGFR